MSSERVSDFMLARLREWGVARVFAYPGDGINGFLGAFDRAADRGPEFIQVRHEEMAAFMACAHAKWTGEVGVCMATSGPGAIHLLNGLYDAKLDHQPVVAIIGQQAMSSLGGSYQQEVDLVSLFKDVASEFVHMATVPEQIRHLVDRAVRTARDQRTVTCIVVPNDLQNLPAVVEPPREHAMLHSGVGIAVQRTVPSDVELVKAAELLNASKRVAILVGAGALHAGDELLQVADLLGAGIAKALLGKAAVPDDLPFVTGSIGLLGTQPSWQMMNGCDALLMVGTNFPYAEYLPKAGRARGVQIDIDGRRLSLRYPMEVNLLGDAAATLRALLPRLERKIDRGWRIEIEHNVARWWKVLEARAMNDAKPVNPQRVFWELSSRLPDDCIVTGDSGSSAFWYARDLRMRAGMMASLSGGLATMGSALPYALAAKLAHPQRQVVALLGDGAMQMLGINALITLAHLWKRWDNPGFTAMVLNNGDLNMVSWEQRVLEGEPKFEGSQNLPPFPYAEYAKLLGLGGIRIDRPEQIGPAWDAAFNADRPTVLEMVTDPDVPPVPAHITAKQMRAYVSALLHGDVNSLGIVIASAKEWWDSAFPPRDDTRP